MLTGNIYKFGKRFCNQPVLITHNRINLINVRLFLIKPNCKNRKRYGIVCKNKTILMLRKRIYYISKIRYSPKSPTSSSTDLNSSNL